MAVQIVATSGSPDPLLPSTAFLTPGALLLRFLLLLPSIFEFLSLSEYKVAICISTSLPWPESLQTSSQPMPQLSLPTRLPLFEAAHRINPWDCPRLRTAVRLEEVFLLAPIKARSCGGLGCIITRTPQPPTPDKNTPLLATPYGNNQPAPSQVLMQFLVALA
ncbi:hypothetical protein MHU86_7273 [Fragilaria crotonensis]|nr:hypothetical protein MHU86_7273 [Fragilaria crotonensis]